MKLNFNSSNNDKKETESKHRAIMVDGEGFAGMKAARKKELPKFEAEIQRLLENYDGAGIAIIIQHEDENGKPDHSEMMIAGVAGLESQISLAKALDNASTKTIEMILEAASASGDTKTLIAVAAALAGMIDDKKEK